MNEVGRDDEVTKMTASASGPEVSRRRALQLGAAITGAVAGAAVLGGTAAASPVLPGAALVGTPGGSDRLAASIASVHGCRAERLEVSADEGWRFLRGDAAGAESPSFDDKAWRTLDLPHDWSIEDLPYATSDDGGATADPATFIYKDATVPPAVPTVIGPFDRTASAGGSSTGWMVGGIGWYRKEINLGGALRRGLPADVRAQIRFEAIFHNATVWLNGKLLGDHHYGYTPVTLDLTDGLVGGKNVLAVRVDNTLADSRWYSGAGIYRHTWFTVTQKVHVPDGGVFVTTPVVGKRSQVNVSVEAANAGAAARTVRARVTLFGPDGRRAGQTVSTTKRVAAGETVTFEVGVAVMNTRQWSPSNPELYQAQTELVSDGSVGDSVRTSFGIRSVVWDGQKGLLINGKQLKIKGGNLHSSYGPVGAVALGSSIEREVRILKAAGFNSIRTAHNPHAEYLLEVCDREGMVVWDEAFDRWTGTSFTPDWQQDIASFVRRDRNHPSVIIWSTGNETNDPVFGRQIHDHLKSFDATRPVVQGATPFQKATDPQYLYQDITDVHYGQPNTSIEAARAAYPDRPVTLSESWGAEVYRDWKFAQDNEWFVGSWVWPAIDFLGESGTGATIIAPVGSDPTKLPPFGNGKFPWFNDFQGEIDLIGQPKPQNYWRRVIYGLTPLEVFVERPVPDGQEQFLHNWSYYDELQSWTWDVPAGKVMKVRVYTAGDSVTIRLNGRDLETKVVTEADQRIAVFQVPYAAGTLTAVTRKGRRVLAIKSLTTVGAPAALKLTSDVRTLGTDRDALAHVLVEVVDRHGRLVPDAVNRVEFDVRGAGALVGVGNGNPHNIDSFQRPRRYTWHGQALAVLRPAQTRGSMSIIARAGALRSDKLVIPVGRRW